MRAGRLFVAVCVIVAGCGSAARAPAPPGDAAIDAAGDALGADVALDMAARVDG